MAERNKDTNYSCGVSGLLNYLEHLKEDYNSGYEDANRLDEVAHYMDKSGRNIDVFTYVTIGEIFQR